MDGSFGVELVAYLVIGVLVGLFLWYHVAKQRKLDRLRREQRDREIQFGQKRAGEQLEAWVEGEEKGDRCPICRGQLGEDKIECPNCKACYHQNCWEVNDGCSRCGYKVSVMGGS